MSAWISHGFEYLKSLQYSQVPNKRGGGENNRGGGLEMVRHSNNRGGGWNNGGGCLEKWKTAHFLGKHLSVIYLCEQ